MSACFQPSRQEDREGSQGGTKSVSSPYRVNVVSQTNSAEGSVHNTDTPAAVSDNSSPGRSSSTGVAATPVPRRRAEEHPLHLREGPRDHRYEPHRLDGHHGLHRQDQEPRSMPSESRSGGEPGPSWSCDYCGRAFRSYEEATEHESEQCGAAATRKRPRPGSPGGFGGSPHVGASPLPPPVEGGDRGPRREPHPRDRHMEHLSAAVAAEMEGDDGRIRSEATSALEGGGGLSTPRPGGGRALSRQEEEGYDPHYRRQPHHPTEADYGRWQDDPQPRHGEAGTPSRRQQPPATPHQPVPMPGSWANPTPVQPRSRQQQQSQSLRHYHDHGPPPPPHLPALLLAPDSRNPLARSLSEFDALACRNIEIFRATAEDADHSALASVGGVGSVSPGQVGVRCVRCVREPLATKDPCASSFPENLGCAMDSVRLVAERHFPRCLSMPGNERAALERASSERERRRAEAGSQAAVDSEEERDIAMLADYCADVCRGLGVYSSSKGGLNFDGEEERERRQQHAPGQGPEGGDDTPGGMRASPPQLAPPPMPHGMISATPLARRTRPPSQPPQKQGERPPIASPVAERRDEYGAEGGAATPQQGEDEPGSAGGFTAYRPPMTPANIPRSVIMHSQQRQQQHHHDQEEGHHGQGGYPRGGPDGAEGDPARTPTDNISHHDLPQGDDGEPQQPQPPDPSGQSPSGGYYPQPPTGPNFPFCQDGFGSWLCRYCGTAPYHYQAPNSHWSAPDGQPPPPRFIDEHMAQCRVYNQGMGHQPHMPPQQPQGPPGHPQYQQGPQSSHYQGGPLPYGSGYGGQGPGQGPHQSSHVGGAPAPPGWGGHGGGAPPPHSMGGSHQAQPGYPGPDDPYYHYQHHGHQGHHPGPPGLSEPRHPSGQPHPKGSALPQGPGGSGAPYQSSDAALRDAIAYLVSAEQATRSQVSISNRAAGPNEGPGALVLPEDQPLLTDYFFHLMKQLRLCRFSEADRKTRGGKRENVAVGYGGLQCIHCADAPSSRKFFWSNVDRLANSFAEIPGHVLKCRRCPNQTKAALAELKLRHPEQMARLPRGSQKVFFRRMWRRLHDSDPDPAQSSKAAATAGGAVKSEGDEGEDKDKDQDPQASTTSRDDTGSPRTPDTSQSKDEKGKGEPVKAEGDAIAKGGAAKPASSFAQAGGGGPIVVGRSTDEAARALALSATRPTPPSPASRVLLAISEDKAWLSDMDCFVRHNIEAFCATEEDVSTAQSDRKYPINLGQVGIRCIHCALSVETGGARGTAVSFPYSISGIYESVREFQRLHLESCPNLPPAVKEKLSSLKGSASLSSVLRRYYVLAAKALGMYDTPDGIRSGAESVPVEFSGSTASSRGGTSLDFAGGKEPPPAGASSSSAAHAQGPEQGRGGPMPGGGGMPPPPGEGRSQGRAALPPPLPQRSPPPLPPHTFLESGGPIMTPLESRKRKAQPSEPEQESASKRGSFDVKHEESV